MAQETSSIHQLSDGCLVKQITAQEESTYAGGQHGSQHSNAGKKRYYSFFQFISSTSSDPSGESFSGSTVVMSTNPVCGSVQTTSTSTSTSAYASVSVSV